MERDFLLYLLYTTLIGIRERSYENNDKITIQLCNLLHNIPLSLIVDEDGKEAYKKLCEDVKFIEMQDWLDMRKEGFNSWYSEYKNNMRLD